MTENRSNTCPLCSRKLTLFNKSFKAGGQWICINCASDAKAVLGQRWSYKDVSIDKLKKDVKKLKEVRREVAASAPKTYGSSLDAPEKAPKSACCPKCHSQNIVPMGHKHKNISVGKAAGGAVLFGGVGLAAGFLGKTEKKVEFYCNDCGKVFKR